MIVPLGQVHALLNRSLRTAGFHGKQRGDFHAVFIPWTAFAPSNWAASLFSPLSPPAFFLYFRLLTWTKICHSSSPVWIFKSRWVVQIVVSGAFGAYSERTDCSQSWIHRAFSLSMPPFPLAAQPCPLTAPALFVFSHGLLSQPQVSLIINDPKGGGPLVALKVLDLAAWPGLSFLLFSQLQWMMTSSLESKGGRGGSRYNDYEDLWMPSFKVPHGAATVLAENLLL